MVAYIPEKGDVVWIDFEPQKGHEIKKKRPALIVSPKSYNQKTGLALAIHITRHVKGYPFEVQFDSTEVEGVILADHLRSLDWRARNAQKITHLSPKTLHEALSKLALLLDWDPR